jgi:hypothetical protein
MGFSDLQLQSIDLSNRALLGSQEIKPETLEYMDALRSAYAIYIGEISGISSAAPSAETER